MQRVAKSKTLKTVFASLMLVVLVMSMAMPTFASITESTNTGKITVSGLEAGVKVDIYQLTTVNYDYTADQPKDTTYSWVSAVKTWIDQNYPTFSDIEEFYKAIENNSEEAKAFYDKLTASIKDGTISLKVTDTKNAQGTPVFPVTEKSLTGSVEFTGVKMGTYLVVIENGYRVYTPSAVNVTPIFNNENKTWELQDQTVVIKSTTPGITKTVTDTKKLKDNYDTTDVISYEIVADLPTYLEKSLAKNYFISDTIKKSMKLHQITKVIGVKGDTETEIPVANYTVAYDQTRPNSEEKATFTIDFKYDSLKQAGFEKIKVQYTATLNKDSSLVMGEEGNNNVAYLIYSNNPYVANSMQTQSTQDVTVYTYGIEVTKVDKKDQNKKLAGAEFTLSQGKDILYFVKTTDGTYYLAKSSDENATTNLVVDNTGIVRIYGLDEGTYTVTETKAPDGYSISTSTYDVTITDANLDGILDEGNETDGIAKITFTNAKYFQLPLTGGNGTTIFIVAGLVLIVTGASVMVISKRKNGKETK